MSKISILNALFTGLALWSSWLFAADSNPPRHPLTVYYSETYDCGKKNLFWMRISYSQATLEDLYAYGNPLNLGSGAEYGSKIKKIICCEAENPNSMEEDEYHRINDFYFKRESQRARFFIKIKQRIQIAGLSRFLDDRTKMPALKPGTQSLKIIHEFTCYILPHSLIPSFATRMLSLGDDIEGVCQIAKENVALREKKSPACRLASYCNRQRRDCELILAGDIQIKQVQKMEHEGQEIVALPLDNLLPFKDQLNDLGYGHFKFHFILGKKLLCRCSNANFCCGGFDLSAEAPQILMFLLNVANMLDETCPSIGVLSGWNPIEPYEIEKAVSEFNKQPGFFKAKIFRTEFYEFYGILIEAQKDNQEVKSPASAQEVLHPNSFGIKQVLKTYFFRPKTLF